MMWIRLTTLNTIINNAPLLIKGAGHLIKMIKQQKDAHDDDRHLLGTDGSVNSDGSVSLEQLQTELAKLHGRLNDNNAADIEQVQLIEQLAKQSEFLAGSLRQLSRQQFLLGTIAVLALICGVVALIIR